MALDLQHLDDGGNTRQHMRAEIESDIATDSLYFGKYLSPLGREAFPELLLTATDHHDDDWLANALNTPGYHLERYEKRTPSGGTTMAKVPYTAAQTLAEGEVNRFYARALCIRAALEGITHLRIRRVKDVAKPRPESVQLIGEPVEAASLLEDLRAHKGVDLALGVPAGPNSGLSVALA